MRQFNFAARLAAPVLGLVLFLIAGCGGSSSSSGGSSSTDTTTTTSSPILAKSDSGTDRSLDGTWTHCDSSLNEREEHTYSGSTLTVTTYINTTGVSCTGGTVDSTNSSGTLTISGQTTVTSAGWLDGTGAASTPPARSAGGSLAATPSATQYLVSGTFAGSTVADIPLLAFIDDSAATYKLWRDADMTDCAALHGGAMTCLINVDPLTK